MLIHVIQEIRPRAERLLADLGLWERRHETVGSFSRGMQQKVAIAAALITGPPILLLDEPTIGLDVAAARTVKDWIARLAADEGKTVLLTTHQLGIAQELAGRVAVIRDGTIIADLPTPGLLSRYAEDRFQVRVADRHGAAVLHLFHPAARADARRRSPDRRGVTALWGAGGLVWVVITAAAYLAIGLGAFRLGERITKTRGTLGAY